MMLVLALAVAAVMTFVIYGERMPLAAKGKPGTSTSQQASTPPLPRS
jgi:hypothetical protein